MTKNQRMSVTLWLHVSHGAPSLPDLHMQHFFSHCEALNLVVLRASTQAATSHDAESLEQYIMICTHGYAPWKCMNHFVPC